MTTIELETGRSAGTAPTHGNGLWERSPEALGGEPSSFSPWAEGGKGTGSVPHTMSVLYVCTYTVVMVF